MIIEHIILNNTFLLSADRCVFWQEKKILILSDLHLGKAGHFRKAGIPIPQTVLKVVTQIQLFKPERIIIVGDLFHSKSNKEHELFLKWRNDFSYLPIELVKGNHDILQPVWYRAAGITIHSHKLTIDDFSFTHDNTECDFIENTYTFCGHIHPGILLKGVGRQSIQLPCFYFAANYAVLPAFGRFTGTARIAPKPSDHIFVIIKNELVKIQ
ncbi:MAG: ligase-associated DNA damage response endonuclease PdeM [Sphingobacteriales bacterium]|nr:ligase-associated DNA damage response endonuclease PdeM [Sphingobacteriales bacterium]